MLMFWKGSIYSNSKIINSFSIQSADGNVIYGYLIVFLFKAIELSAKILLENLLKCSTVDLVQNIVHKNVKSHFFLVLSHYFFLFYVLSDQEFKF